MKILPYPGLEPGTSGLEVQRAIHCASRALIKTVFLNIVYPYTKIDLESRKIRIDQISAEAFSKFYSAYLREDFEKKNLRGL